MKEKASMLSFPRTVSGNPCKALLVVLILLLQSSLSFSEQTGAAFLKIGAGARPVAMASAFTAIADDASALYWNPSGIATIPNKQFTFTHSQWIENMNYEFAGFVHPMNRGAFGLGVYYLAEGTFEGRDENRARTSDFTASDLAVSVSMGRRMAFGNVGMNLKIITQRIESEKATGFAVDLGYKYRQGNSPLSLGLSLQNLGPEMKFIDEGYKLPLTLSTGLGYRVAGALSIGLDIRRRLHTGDTNISIGTEYWVMSAVALRTGYLSQLVAFTKSTTDTNNSKLDNQIEKLAGLGAGIGLKIGSYMFDYALVPQGELGNTQRISLTANF